MIRNLWHHREYLTRNALREVRYRYSGSVLGVYWNFLNPLVQIALYYVVFSRLMWLKVPGTVDPRFAFPLYLCAGVLAWLAFTETLGRCTTAFVANARYLRVLPVPEQVFVAQEALASTLGLAISMSLLALATLVVRGGLGLAWVQVPLILVLFQGFAFGLGLALGVLNVFIRDLGQMIHLVLMVWFWATPIAYVETMLPGRVRQLLTWNPAWVYITSLQRIVVADEWATPATLGLCLALALGACTGGYLVLRGLRHEIRDVL
ncbi:MAG: ABC transporter permease [Planctomycetes bacterium]|nr:ABC transporter permease [Planctomycetota bacterium]